MMLLNLRSFFEIEDLNATFKKILQARANNEKKYTPFDFYVHRRSSSTVAPEMIYKNKTKGVYEMVLESLKHCEEVYNENVNDLIGDEGEWKDFIYTSIFTDEQREALPWQEFLSSEIDNLPTTIPIDLNKVLDEIIELLLDEGEMLFIDYDLDSSSFTSSSSWYDSDSSFSSDYDSDDSDDSDYTTDDEDEVIGA